jgi:hypothetical protein
MPWAGVKASSGGGAEFVRNDVSRTRYEWPLNRSPNFAAAGLIQSSESKGIRLQKADDN